MDARPGGAGQGSMDNGSAGAGAARHQPGPGTGPAAGIAELGAEFDRSRTPYGADALIACDRLVRIYAADGIEVQALQGLDLLVGEGELTAMVGASGSGKSTLMNILAGLDAPTAGSVRVAGHDLAAMTAADRVGYRRRVVGFVWQQTSRNLLPVPDRAAERDAADAVQRHAAAPARQPGAGTARPARRRALRGPAARSSCPAASSSAPRSPPRWPTGRGCCWPTSRPASSTARPPRDVFGALQSANASLGVTVLVVTHDPAVSEQVRADDRDPGRADEQRDPAARDADGAGNADAARGRVRGAGPGRPGAAARARWSSRSACGTGSGWRPSPITSASGRTTATAARSDRPAGHRRRHRRRRAADGRRRRGDPHVRQRRAWPCTRCAASTFTLPPGAAGRAARPVRIGQDHAAEHRRRAGPADQRARVHVAGAGGDAR